MKKINIIFFAVVLALVSSCKLDVLDDPYGITQDKASEGSGPLYLLAGALKQGFEAHNQMCWSAGLIGNEELSSIAANISQTPILIETSGVVPADLGQNTAQANGVYTSIALAENARRAVSGSTYNDAAKNLFFGNINLIEGIVYGDWAKFYESCYEFGTGTSLNPDQTRDLAIAKLTEAIRNFTAYNNATDLGGANARGLFNNTDAAVKCCNGLIGMLLFDTGAKGRAAEFLQKSYVRADAGRELTYKNSNQLTANSDGIFSAVVSGASFQLNQYSPGFRNDRITADTLRRFPNNWFVPQVSQTDNQNKINYFYPAAPGTGTVPAASRVVGYPIITANEIALMLADPAVSASMTVAQRQKVIEDVLTSWRIPAALAATLSQDPAITLERVARYEYAGRGRRWSAVPGKYKRWPLAIEFTFR
jgi:hypothetical protein